MASHTYINEDGSYNHSAIKKAAVELSLLWGNDRFDDCLRTVLQRAKMQKELFVEQQKDDRLAQTDTVAFTWKQYRNAVNALQGSSSAPWSSQYREAEMQVNALREDYDAAVLTSQKEAA